MTNSEMAAFMEDEFARIVTLKKAKGNAYGSDQDAFRSVTEVAGELETANEELIFIYMSKHWDVLRSHRKDLKKVKDIGERIDDLVIYLMMMKALIFACPTVSSDPSSASTCDSSTGSR